MATCHAVFLVLTCLTTLAVKTKNLDTDTPGDNPSLLEVADEKVEKTSHTKEKRARSEYKAFHKRKRLAGLIVSQGGMLSAKHLDEKLSNKGAVSPPTKSRLDQQGAVIDKKTDSDDAHFLKIADEKADIVSPIRKKKSHSEYTSSHNKRKLLPRDILFDQQLAVKDTETSGDDAALLEGTDDKVDAACPRKQNVSQSESPGGPTKEEKWSRHGNGTYLYTDSFSESSLAGMSFTHRTSSKNFLVWVVICILFGLAIVYIFCSRKPPAGEEKHEERKGRQSIFKRSKGHQSMFDKVQEVTPTMISYPQEFQVSTSDGVNQSFRWILPSEAKESGLPCAASPMEALSHGLVDEILAPWSPISIQDALGRGGVSASSWPPEKIQHLAEEVAVGKACLLLNAEGQIRRLTQIVQLIIIHPTTRRVIVRKETFTQTASSSDIDNKREAFRSQMKTTDSSLSIRRLPSESVATAADRCLQEKLNVEPDIIELNWDKVKSSDSEEFSDFYPGLTTIVTRHIILGSVVTTDEQQLKLIAADEESLANDRGFQTQYNFWGETKILKWCWQDPDKTADLFLFRTRVREHLGQSRATTKLMGALKAVEAAAKLKEAISSPKTSPRWKSSEPRARNKPFIKHDSSFRDSSIENLTPWTPREVQDLLEQYSTSAEALGTSFEELCKGAAKGHFVFGHQKTNGSGKLVIVKDCVHLKLVAHTGAVLVQTTAPNGADSLQVSKCKFHWPTLRMQLQETAWDTARRIARSCLGLDDDDLFIETQPQIVAEEQQGDGSCRTRKWLVVGRLNPEAVMHGQLKADKL